MRIPAKPAAAGVSAHLAVVLVWTAEQFGLVMPAYVGASFAGLLMFLAYYWVKG